MKTILLILLIFLFCQRGFSQSDSVIIFNSDKIYCIEIKDSVGAYANMDVSDESFDEVRIVSLTDSFLSVEFIKDKKSVKKNIDIRQINEIGYKNGKAGLAGMGWGFLGGLTAGFLTIQIHNSIVKDDIDGGWKSIEAVLTAATFPILGAIGGLIIGAQNDSYKMISLAKMDKKAKYTLIKSVIKDSMEKNKARLNTLKK